MNYVNVRNHLTSDVVEDIYFRDRVLLNDEIEVVNQWMNLPVVDEHSKLIIEQKVEEEEEVERRVMIENEMDDEIDDDWNFQMYVLDDIDENVLVLVEKMEEDHLTSVEVDEQNKQYHFHCMLLFERMLDK
jgi:hypothetical protein